MSTKGDSSLLSAYTPETLALPSNRVTAGDGLHEWANDPAVQGQAALLYRLAEILEGDASINRRVQGVQRSTVVDTIQRCASITRQFACRVARRGTASVLVHPSIARTEEITLDDIARRILVGRFSAVCGCEPSAGELQRLEGRHGKDLRAGVVVAWGLIRKAVRSEEVQ